MNKLLLLVLATIFIVGILKVYGVINKPDLQCTTTHKTETKPPKQLKTALDYFEMGNYHYDKGMCKQAIIDYTHSIELDPNYPQSYNNRAYTNMRLRNYKDALYDLDQAIYLNPEYVEALMNRGDIYNYYYNIDRQKAIADYDRVIDLGIEKDKSNSVCGHKAMAETDNFVPLVFLRFMISTDCK